MTYYKVLALIRATVFNNKFQLSSLSHSLSKKIATKNNTYNIFNCYCIRDCKTNGVFFNEIECKKGHQKDAAPMDFERQCITEE